MGSPPGRLLAGAGLRPDLRRREARFIQAFAGSAWCPIRDRRAHSSERSGGIGQLPDLQRGALSAADAKGPDRHEVVQRPDWPRRCAKRPRASGESDASNRLAKRAINHARTRCSPRAWRWRPTAGARRRSEDHAEGWPPSRRSGSRASLTLTPRCGNRANRDTWRGTMGAGIARWLPRRALRSPCRSIAGAYERALERTSASSLARSRGAADADSQRSALSAFPRHIRSRSWRRPTSGRGDPERSRSSRSLSALDAAAAPPRSSQQHEQPVHRSHCRGDQPPEQVVGMHSSTRFP